VFAGVQTALGLVRAHFQPDAKSLKVSSSKASHCGPCTGSLRGHLGKLGFIPWVLLGDMGRTCACTPSRLLAKFHTGLSGVLARVVPGTVVTVRRWGTFLATAVVVIASFLLILVGSTAPVCACVLSALCVAIAGTFRVAAGPKRPLAFFCSGS
jgi:hypothetical protein